MKFPLFVRRIICSIEGVKWLSDDGVVFQESYNDCGEACVKMVLKFFGQRNNLSDETLHLRYKLPEGSSLVEISKTIEDFGLQAQGYEFSSITDLQQFLAQHSKMIALVVMKGLRIPYIYSSADHLVVLVSIRDQYVEVRDPFLGHVTLSNKLLDKKWTRICLLISRKEES